MGLLACMVNHQRDSQYNRSLLIKQVQSYAGMIKFISVTMGIVPRQDSSNPEKSKKLAMAPLYSI